MERGNDDIERELYVTKMRNAWLMTALTLAAACGDDTEGEGFAGDAESAQATSPEAGSQDGGSRVDAGSDVDAATTAPQQRADAAPADRMELDAATSLDARVVAVDARTPAAPDASSADAGIAVRGRWHSSFGGTEVIDSTQWSFTSLVEYDNQTRVAITQNAATDMFNPSKYNKYVWTAFQSDSFYYCTVDYGLDSIQAARSSTKQADASDPDNTGCGGFSWTKLSPAIEIDATWKRSDASTLSIDSDDFGSAEVVSYDNASNSAVLRNAPSGDAGTAADFDKVVWTEPTASALSICFVERGLASAEAARSSTRQVDFTAPSTGCLGAAWTVLSR